MLIPNADLGHPGTSRDVLGGRQTDKQIETDRQTVGILFCFLFCVSSWYPPTPGGYQEDRQPASQTDRKMFEGFGWFCFSVCFTSPYYGKDTFAEDLYKGCLKNEQINIGNFLEIKKQKDTTVLAKHHSWNQTDKDSITFPIYKLKIKNTRHLLGQNEH